MTHPADRPRTLDLVSRVEDGWRRWRVETREGGHYVDVRDKLAERSVRGLGRGLLL